MEYHEAQATLWQRRNKAVLKSGDAMLEITEYCATACEYCYGSDRMHAKSKHVPLEILQRRVDWIVEYTDAVDLYLIGGEPLAYPYFREIVEYARSKGFELLIITSGKIVTLPAEHKNYQAFAHEAANRDYLLELYKQGLIRVELTYHWERNHHQYLQLLGQLVTTAPRHIQSLQERADRLQKSGLRWQQELAVNALSWLPDTDMTDLAATYAQQLQESNQRDFIDERVSQLRALALKYPSIFSTVNLTDKVNNQRYMAAMKEIYQVWMKDIDVDVDKVEFSSENGKLTFEQMSRLAHELMQTNFVNKLIHSRENSSRITLRGVEVRFKLKVWAVANFSYHWRNNQWYRYVDRTEGTSDNSSVCPVMKWKLAQDHISMDTFIIRADGTCSMVQPTCLNGEWNFACADEWLDSAELIAHVKSRARWLKGITVHSAFNRAQETGDVSLNCQAFGRADKQQLLPAGEGYQGNPSGKCSCPHRKACNACINFNKFKDAQPADAVAEVKSWS